MALFACPSPPERSVPPRTEAAGHAAAALSENVAIIAFVRRRFVQPDLSCQGGWKGGWKGTPALIFPMVQAPGRSRSTEKSDEQGRRRTQEHALLLVLR